MRRLGLLWRNAWWKLVLLKILLYSSAASGQLTLASSGLNFGSVQVGNSSTLSVSVSNSSKSNITISQASVTGTGFIDPRHTRSHATSEEPHPGSDQGHEPRAQAAGEGRYQAAKVVADVLGVSGGAMLDALVAGETDLERLAKLAKGQPHQTHPICFRNSSNGKIGRA